MRKLEYAVYIMMPLLFGIIKLSVVLFYRRIFRGIFFNRYSIAMCFVLLLWSFSFCMSTVLQCGRHPEYLWTPGPNDSKCYNDTPWDITFGVSDILTDLMILAMPLPFIFKLQISTPRKIGLFTIFLLGLLYEASSMIGIIIIILRCHRSTASAIVRLIEVLLDIYSE